MPRKKRIPDQSSLKEVEEIIEGLLRLQDKIMKLEGDWIKEEARESIGNVAQIEVYNIYGTYSERLKLEDGYRIVKTREPPKHIIRVHIDTFLDLLTWEIDFYDAYAKGLVEFEGENYHIHAIKWSKGFERLRKYIIRKIGR